MNNPWITNWIATAIYNKAINNNTSFIDFKPLCAIVLANNGITAYGNSLITKTVIRETIACKLEI